MCRLPKIASALLQKLPCKIGFFCKRAQQKQGSFAKWSWHLRESNCHRATVRFYARKGLATEPTRHQFAFFLYGRKKNWWAHSREITWSNQADSLSWSHTHTHWHTHTLSLFLSLSLSLSLHPVLRSKHTEKRRVKYFMILSRKNQGAYLCNSMYATFCDPI